MIPRTAKSEIIRNFKLFPVITLTGPRQSGKTTLCRKIFPKAPYVNLERPQVRALARAEPEAFLLENLGGIIDEAQNVPELFSAAQALVDEDRSRRFIFTGSSNFLLAKNVRQSLAGRAAILRLLPLSLEELGKKRRSASKEQLIFRGGYPGIWADGFAPADFFSNYYEHYVEKDLRFFHEIRELTAFRQFLRLCAGATGNEFNASSFAADVGVSVPTIQNWLAVLEAAYVVFRLPPFFANIRKRLVKSPKIYFYDTGLACWLIGVRSEEQLATHPLRGALFENLVVAEFVKRAAARGEDTRSFFFYRDNFRREIDLVREDGEKLFACEIKAAREFHKDFFRNLDYFRELFAPRVAGTRVIYDGTEELAAARNGVVNFRNL